PYQVRGEDGGFVSATNVRLQARANGYDSDGSVWTALGREENLAVVDRGTLADPSAFGDSGFIKGIDPQATHFDPVTLVLTDRVSGNRATVKVIGVVELWSNTTFSGIHISEKTFAAVYGKPDVHRYFVKTVPGANARGVAREIEASLLETGVEADSL